MTTPLNVTRRNLLQTSACSALAICGVGAIGAATFYPVESLAASIQPASLKIPPLQTGTSSGDTLVYKLGLQNGVTEFVKGVKTPTSGINGSYLGPTLKVRKGNKIRFQVTNNLGETSTLHWHGVHLPASQDGGPHQVISAGETWNSEFDIKQKAASLWYHPHLMGKTAEHVWRGLAGMLIVEDEESDALDLPINYGVDDIPLVLQDRAFSRDGRMDYDPSMHFIMMGMTGDVPLANGTTAAFFEAKTRLLRLRILNGSNASFYNLGFEDNRTFHQIATDGGFLEAPVQLQRLLLSPAERAEIIVELNPGDIATLRNFAWNSQSSGSGMGRMMGGMSATPEFKFLDIRAADELSDETKIPTSLTKMDWLSEADATRTRKFELQMNMGPRVMIGLLNSHLINDKVMKISRVDETIKLGATEIWEVHNSSFMAHPFHIHDVQFQILDRNGNKPDPGERGRKDVVLVNPGETVRLIMKFEDYSDANAPFMYHCHILEHEDAGMMGQFVVV